MTPDQRPDTAALAEAFLFLEGGSLALKKLQHMLDVDQTALHAALDELQTRLHGRGVALIRTHSEAMLAVAPSVAKAVTAAAMRELGRDIGDAGLEVLSIVLYRGPSTRAQIDYIRGVNTSSTIRNLLSRGLVDRAANPEDAREYLYRPTPELLAHLGITRSEELPEYTEIRAELDAFEKQAAAEQSTPDH